MLGSEIAIPQRPDTAISLFGFERLIHGYRLLKIRRNVPIPSDGIEAEMAVSGLDQKHLMTDV